MQFLRKLLSLTYVLVYFDKDERISYRQNSSINYQCLRAQKIMCKTKAMVG